MVDDASIERALQTLRVTGLSSAEARRRSRQQGLNEVGERSVSSGWDILGRQLKGAWTWLLVGACVVSVALHQSEDALLIAVLLVLGGALAFAEEFHAERALLALRAQSAAQVPVVRDGSPRRVSAVELVPGDILVLRPTEEVPADARLLCSDQLAVLEHALTGVSRPVSKRAAQAGASIPMAVNSVFRGSRVTAGWGIAEVFATGRATRVASLAQATQNVVERRALLEEQLENVGKQLVLACTGIVALVALGELLWSRPVSEVFLSGVSLAVAAVPESLPAVVTLALALGGRVLARERVLVRELDAIETAGATTIICTGKTGILTAAPELPLPANAPASEPEAPRAGVAEAVAQARSAGVRTLLLTGDSLESARTLAQRVGILAAGDDPAELVRADASAEDKLQTIRELQRKGHVVAMTGESTNNAPALRAADIGFSLRESDAITREASDMVLLDNDFPRILTAIRLGRGIYDNVRKTIVYLMAGNLAELVLMLFSALCGLPPPLSPLQLLWVNLITDGPPAFTLVCDPIGQNVLERPPRPRGEALLGRQQWLLIASVGTLQAAACLGLFLADLGSGHLERAQGRVFSLLVFTEVLWSFAARDLTRPFWKADAPANARLLALVLLSSLCQVAIGQAPLGQRLFSGQPPPLRDFGLAFLLALALLMLAEGCKLVLAKAQQPASAQSVHGAGRIRQ